MHGPSPHLKLWGDRPPRFPPLKKAMTRKNKWSKEKGNKGKGGGGGGRAVEEEWPKEEE